MIFWIAGLRSCFIPRFNIFQKLSEFVISLDIECFDSFPEISKIVYKQTGIFYGNVIFGFWNFTHFLFLFKHISGFFPIKSSSIYFWRWNESSNCICGGNWVWIFLCIQQFPFWYFGDSFFCLYWNFHLNRRECFHLNRTEKYHRAFLFFLFRYLSVGNVRIWKSFLYSSFPAQYDFLLMVFPNRKRRQRRRCLARLHNQMEYTRHRFHQGFLRLVRLDCFGFLRLYWIGKFSICSPLVR